MYTMPRIVWSPNILNLSARIIHLIVAPLCKASFEVPRGAGLAHREFLMQKAWSLGLGPYGHSQGGVPFFVISPIARALGAALVPIS